MQRSSTARTLPWSPIRVSARERNRCDSRVGVALVSNTFGSSTKVMFVLPLLVSVILAPRPKTPFSEPTRHRPAPGGSEEGVGWGCQMVSPA